MDEMKECKHEYQSRVIKKTTAMLGGEKIERIYRVLLYCIKCGKTKSIKTGV